MKRLLSVVLALASAFSGKAYADDIFKGARGPTNWQLDVRASAARNERGKALSNSAILKYWNGDERGIWAFVNVPYKFVESDNRSANGLGDVTFGIGPRGRIGNLHGMLAGSATFPTGDSEQSLGNGRYDGKIGLLSTYLSRGKGFEIDGFFEYVYTGKNKKGINPPNEIYAGVLTGGGITDRSRFAAGFTGTIGGNDDFALNARIVGRYTVSPALHFEAIGYLPIDNRRLPKTTGIGLFARYNF